MIEIISLDNKTLWDKVVGSMCAYDFYFLNGYHQLDNSGTPLLLHYQNNDDEFSISLIIRKIENSEYNDATSVYGYCGPLTRSLNPRSESILDFQEELKHFFDAHSIVSVFSRFHSLFPFQQHILKGMGKIIDSNPTVGIDLTLPEKEQKSQYARSLKYVINKLKREGIVVRKASSKEDIDSFIAIYNETMDRVHASAMYYFSPEYFYRFLDLINSFILLAFHGDKIISGSLCTVCNGVIQAHLNATKDDFLHLSPLKLVLEEARSLGVQQGMRILHLGGGFREKDDSLFVFKSRFSKQLFPFKVWNYIHNQEAYNELVNRKFSGNIPNTSFFPIYRA